MTYDEALDHFNEMVDLCQGGIDQILGWDRRFTTLAWTGRGFALFYGTVGLFVLGNGYVAGFLGIVLGVVAYWLNERQHRSYQDWRSRHLAYWQEGVDLWTLGRMQFIEEGTFPYWVLSAADDHARTWTHD